LDFKDRPLEFIRYVQRAYGDVCRFKIGGQYWYLLAHPDHIWDLTVARADEFQKPAIAKRLWSKFLGNGVLTEEGAEWQRHSRMMRPAFHNKRIHAYGTTMVAYTRRMMDSWTPGEERDVSRDMTGLTLEIVGKTLFDADVRHGSAVVGEAMLKVQEEMLNHIHFPFPVPTWWPSESNRQKLAAIADIATIVTDVIADRRSSGRDRGDLLSALVFAEGENGYKMSDQQLRDEAMTLFFAGHETTANSLTWAWYLLARHPEVAERLRAEVTEVTQGRDLTASDLGALPYLDMVVKEAMRILPSVWVFMKEPKHDVEIGGYRIPKGAQIMISPFVTQHDARWFPSPETFDPERFSPARSKEIRKGAYVPFSAGSRVCLGKPFAMMESRMILGTMIQHMQPTIPEDYQPEFLAELSMHPKGGLPILVRPTPHSVPAPETPRPAQREPSPAPS
jgi:cytochrome P450